MPSIKAVYAHNPDPLLTRNWFRAAAYVETGGFIGQLPGVNVCNSSSLERLEG